MKQIKNMILACILLFAVSMPVTAYAQGEGNIDTGGGGLG